MKATLKSSRSIVLLILFVFLLPLVSFAADTIRVNIPRVKVTRAGNHSITSGANSVYVPVEFTFAMSADRVADYVEESNAVFHDHFGDGVVEMGGVSDDFGTVYMEIKANPGRGRVIRLTSTASGSKTVTVVQAGDIPEPEPEPEPEPDEKFNIPGNWKMVRRHTDGTGSSYVTDITFYDGLGYPEQTVNVGASPSGGRNIVTPIVYDRMRRGDSVLFLPYAASTVNTVMEESTPLAAQSAFYAGLYGSVEGGYAGDATAGDCSFCERGMEYDRNGNILALQRFAESGSAAADNLAYSYSGNRLTGLAGSSGGAVLGASYGYDAGGNMTYDGRRGIGISYNILNLPARVSEKTGAAAADGATKAVYLYSADGMKQSVADATGSGGYLYLGSLVLAKGGEGFSLASTGFGGGRIIGGTDGSRAAYYYGTDHLGSVRIITDGSGSVVERNDYYPLGMRTDMGNGYRQLAANLYRYNGKEVQATGGLGFTDYGARMYDDFTGRWFVPDPLAEKYLPFSPYMYCGGDPIAMIDVDGRFLIIPIIIYYRTAKFLEKNSSNNNFRELGYAMQHPINALIVGWPIDGGNWGNIATVASNFSVNIALKAGLTEGHEGDQGNALRHVIWQSIITRRLGEEHAKRIGNAHENNPNVDLNIRRFKKLEDADPTIDLLNNIIGREIGRQNPKASNGELAKKAVEEFYKSGLWTAVKVGGNYIIKKTKITEEQYKTALEEIDKKNKNGINKNK